MSLGYAEKLSFIEDVGQVGMSEIFDPPPVLQEKIELLGMMIKKSKHLVVFTGAGISTSSGIPDFRGPKGIWTLQREGKPLPEASLPFHRAIPSMTHMALVELEKAGFLKFVISQTAWRHFKKDQTFVLFRPTRYILYDIADVISTTLIFTDYFSNGRILMASIFVLEFQGKNLLNCMGIPSWKSALPVGSNICGILRWKLLG